MGAWGSRDPVLDLWREYLLEALAKAGAGARVLFVAHGIPERNVKRGEDYPCRVMDTALKLAASLPESTPWSVAFQSKVGPVAWTQPYLEDGTGAVLPHRGAAGNHAAVVCGGLPGNAVRSGYCRRGSGADGGRRNAWCACAPLMTIRVLPGRWRGWCVRKVMSREAKAAPRIVVVGGGVAGLATAYLIGEMGRAAGVRAAE